MKNFILLKNGFEEIEALTILDYLRRAEIDIFTVSLEKGLEVQGSHKIIVKADFMFDEILQQDIELLFIPGGMPAAKDISEMDSIIKLIQDLDKKGKIIATICAGGLSLGKAGILKDKKFTCYPGFEEKIESIGKFSEELVIIDQNVITSRGPATSVLLALELIELLKGKNTGEKISKEILFDKLKEKM